MEQRWYTSWASEARCNRQHSRRRGALGAATRPIGSAEVGSTWLAPAAAANPLPARERGSPCTRPWTRRASRSSGLGTRKGYWFPHTRPSFAPILQRPLPSTRTGKCRAFMPTHFFYSAQHIFQFVVGLLHSKI